MDMVSNLLSTERKKKGLEIIDVEQNTGIRSAYLVALEEGRYSALPGDVYVKGFIRNYGNYLGLDGSHLVNLYTDSIQEIERSKSAAIVSPKNEATSKKLSMRQLLNALIVILILVASAWSLYLWQKPSPSTPRPTKQAAASKPETQSAVQPPVQPASTPAGVAVSVPVANPVTTNKPVVLRASFSDRCWTSVIADGKSIFEGIPKIGESFTWEADRQIIMNFGNAAAVELTFNGQPVGKIGERGDVVVKTFTAPVKP
jgi:cytoskeletal protein RodZ